tara:strand:- start:3955 stop:4323 length:369 start_codon:yes stop_codon:yes gene_type:complete
MSIYKFIGLAVFACVTFIGGYIFGEWSTYDEKLLSQIRMSDKTEAELTYKTMELSHNNFLLKQLIKIKTFEEVDELIEIRKMILSSELLKLEELLKDLPDANQELISNFIVDEVKKTIGDDI